MQDSSSPKENQTKRLRQRIVVPNSFLEYNENDATSPGTTDAADVDIFKRKFKLTYFASMSDTACEVIHCC